jgi:hypothetical protein
MVQTIKAHCDKVKVETNEAQEREIIIKLPLARLAPAVNAGINKIIIEWICRRVA